jgi:hypothetical protein
MPVSAGKVIVRYGFWNKFSCEPRFPLLGIVLATVPRFMKCHVVARMNFDPPTVLCIIRWSRDKAKLHPISLNLERLNPYSRMLDRADFC